MDFELSEELAEVQKLARDFSEKEIAPSAAQDDREHIFRKDLVVKMGELGFYGCLIPELYGGNGLGFLAHVLISEEIAFFIAKNIRSNVRELEGALKKVLAFARFTGRELSLELAKEALRDILNVASRQISVDGIQKTVAEYFKLKISDMHSKKRSRNIARPRQVAMSLAKDLTPMSLPEIGEAFGNRDHTTVLHACRTISTLRKKDAGLNRDYLVLEQVLKG